MGLAGPRNRRKLDYDPNNTRWTRDETTFGQKILRAQGWQPGKFLGAQDTTHAQLHSAASLAPIKINLKDDTLGLGAKIRQKQSDECTGLDVFKDLLGRLNGKSEETLEKERQIRSVIKTNLVVERKYGPMRFVSGGLLVGDHMMAELVDKKPASTPIEDESASEASENKSVKKEKERKDKKSKKRKASESEETDTSDSKREKKRKKRSKVDEGSKNDATGIEKSAKKKKDKEKKRSKRSGLEPEEENAGPIGSEVKRKKSKKSRSNPQDSLPGPSAESSEDAVSEKARRKEKKKEKKRKQADSTEASVATATISSSTTTLTTTPQDSGSSTPTNTGALAPHALSARHRARSRNIASKKMAFGDMQALNQIFMIKPV
ncbi:hypothetical protein F4859DRAFT_365417 [Xylaria cf. heliscus]|nr:hypothetical protein F4859DRAFT_365417 [Xylaria cf. heliscus]